MPHLRQGELVFLECGHDLPEPHYLRRLKLESLPQRLEVARHPADIELEGGPLDRFQSAPKKRVLVGVRLCGGAASSIILNVADGRGKASVLALVSVDRSGGTALLPPKTARSTTCERRRGRQTTERIFVLLGGAMFFVLCDANLSTSRIVFRSSCITSPGDYCRSAPYVNGPLARQPYGLQNKGVSEIYFVLL